MHRCCAVSMALLWVGALVITPSGTHAATRLVGNLPHQGGQPLEALPGVDTEYGELRTPDGARLRTLVTRPQGDTGRLPAVLFAQWLSCDSIELRPNAKDGWAVMLRRLITESHMVWQRTEKSGVGDSQGTPCAKLDYETELAHHRAALSQLRARPDVDPKRIVIYGASMGSNYAPLLAADEDIAGVVVWGGGATTWFERMTRFERNALELSDADPQTLSTEMNARAAYFARYLLKGESPAAIASSDPELGKVWPRIVGTNSEGHYGRPFAFDQQAQRQNWAGAWARVHAPVLVLYGEYDWFESKSAAALIADIVNRRQSGSATFRELPKLNHHFTRYDAPRAAYREEGGTVDADPAVDAILGWLTQRGLRPGNPSAALDSYERARGVLLAGVEALGGRAALDSLNSVQRDWLDTWVDPGQGAHPWHGARGTVPPPNSGSDRSPSWGFIDYATRRWQESQQFSDSPTESAVVRDVVAADRGFRTIRYMQENPFYDAFAADDLESQRTRKLRRHPEGILRMALARPDTLESLGTLTTTDEGAQDVISFVDALGTRVCLYFDAQTHRLTRTETLRDHPIAGDATTTTTFSDYRPVGRLLLPFKYVDRTAGYPTHELDVLKIDVDVATPEDGFEPPTHSVAVQHDPTRLELQKISDSLYLIRGAYNVMFSVFPDHVVVFEAPLGDAYVRECLAIIRSVTDKPIRYVIATHFHYDHIAGIRTFIAAGVPVLTTPDTKGVIELALRAHHTLRPDPFDLARSMPAIETVAGTRSLDAGGVQARVYDFGPTPHVAQLLVAYFPREKLLYVPDLMDVLTDELVIAGVDAVPMRAKIRKLGLDVARFVPVHGMPIDGAHFQRAYAVRGKIHDTTFHLPISKR